MSRIPPHNKAQGQPGSRFRWLLLFLAAILAGASSLALAGAQSAEPAESTAADHERHIKRERAKLLEAMGADQWHAAGMRGRGVKVAILDSGFRGYRDHLGKSLPAKVSVKSFRHDGNLEARDSQHGILCAEVIHAVAPEAELIFANWETDQPHQFLKAVLWARQQGAKVVSCSIIMPSWSDGEGGGLICSTFARILGGGEKPDDMICFASAGNTAERHWSGDFTPDKNGWHQWQTGKIANAIAPWGDGRVSVELYYKTGADYELIVTNGKGESIGQSLSHPGKDRACRVVVFVPAEWDSYKVKLRLKKGKPAPFHLVVLGGGLDMTRRNGSIPFPGDSRGVVAVGAVYENGRRASYSSCGPNGSRPKPDLVATIPFPSLWRPRPFTGTSAAAPQAAGLAALLWSLNPDWSADKVRFVLNSAAHDLGPSGHDFDTGFGRIALPTDLIAPEPSLP